MNSYYIAPKQVWMDNLHCFHPQLHSHYLDLDNGLILLSAHFKDHSGIEHWESLEGVRPLPHPVFEGRQGISGPDVNVLNKLGIVHGHTILDLAHVVGKINPLMKLRAI